MVVLVQCPRCHNRMKYQPKDGILDGKTKACVYCGYAMSVSKYVVTAPKSAPSTPLPVTFESGQGVR